MTEHSAGKNRNLSLFWIIALALIALLVSAVPITLILRLRPQPPLPQYATASAIEEVYATQIARLKELLSRKGAIHITNDDRKLFAQSAILSVDIGYGKTPDRVVYTSPRARSFSVSFPREPTIGSPAVNIGYSDKGDVAIYETILGDTGGSSMVILLEFDLVELEKAVQQWRQDHGKRGSSSSS